MATVHIFLAGPLPAAPLVYLPESASEAKVAKLEALGARLVRVGSDAVEAEVAARAEAERCGASYISPYNDLAVIFHRVTSSPLYYLPLCSLAHQQK